MANTLTVKVKKSGRLKAPVLDHGQLTMVGNEMVTAQKDRWAHGINAGGSTAKPLSKPYIYRKARIRRTNRPKRDMHLTGLFRENFTLRKAINGIVRAEPTSRKARDRRPANAVDQMVGFAGSDVKVVYDASRRAYGDLAKTLWFETNG